MKELVVISGKGGTGKTSLVACFAVLASAPVLADCDVDAADLHLVLSPEVLESHDFYSGHEAIIKAEECIGCGICQPLCRFDAITGPGIDNKYSINPTACEGCGVCVRFCPMKAIEFPSRYCGQWMISQTRCGPMVHAKLGIAAENSGKLVSTVRRAAHKLAVEQDRSLVIIDGSPGIGCPVIASLTGADQVLVVTEPTVSGLHDLERVLSLTKHFDIPTAVCVNKWDLNPEMTQQIEQLSEQKGSRVAGRVRYDPQVTQAQILRKSVVEIQADSAEDIRKVWRNLDMD
jgi:MinD superfamily P-loop ATPase